MNEEGKRGIKYIIRPVKGNIPLKEKARIQREITQRRRVRSRIT
jgi:hypothetical protein